MGVDGDSIGLTIIIIIIIIITITPAAIKQKHCNVFQGSSCVQCMCMKRLVVDILSIIIMIVISDF